jgi:hypothetical protein
MVSGGVLESASILTITPCARKRPAGALKCPLRAPEQPQLGQRCRMTDRPVPSVLPSSTATTSYAAGRRTPHRRQQRAASSLAINDHGHRFGRPDISPPVRPARAKDAITGRTECEGRPTGAGRLRGGGAGGGRQGRPVSRAVPASTSARRHQDGWRNRGQQGQRLRWRRARTGCPSRRSGASASGRRCVAVADRVHHRPAARHRSGTGGSARWRFRVVRPPEVTTGPEPPGAGARSGHRGGAGADLLGPALSWKLRASAVSQPELRSAPGRPRPGGTWPAPTSAATAGRTRLMFGIRMRSFR